MESLSVTQEFVLCALKEDGKIPLLKATEVTVCLVSSGVWELVHHHAVRYDDKEDLVCAGALPKQVAYLQPLYEQIKEREPVSAHKLVESYVFAATEKNLHQLKMCIRDRPCGIPMELALWSHRYLLTR